MPVTSPLHAPVEEIIHGVLVRDPYRWLEDRSLPETEEWIREQQRRCDAYFSECEELLTIRQRVQEYVDVEIVDQPTKIGKLYFYRRRNKGQEQGCIYVRNTSTGAERLLVDPSPNGSFVSVGIHRISEDGTLLAYEVRRGGENRKAIHIVDVDTGIALPDKLEIGFARGFAFTSDKGGFYYCHDSSPSEDHAIRLHHFESSGDDEVIFRVARSPESRLILVADEVHLGAIWIHKGSSALVADFFVAKRDKASSWEQVFAERRLPYSPMLKHGRIFALSYDDAPNGTVVELNNNGRPIRTIIPQTKAMILQLVIAGDRIFARYLRQLIPSIECWTLSGALLEKVDAPIDGAVQLLADHSTAECHLFYSYESFIQPPMVFEYLPDTRESQLWHRCNVAGVRDTYSITRRAFVSSDQTSIPMTLVASDRCGLSANVPVIMTSYGGFGIPMTPQFSVLVAIMMELGAIFALPHIRGGGDFGKDWHDAARGRNRQVAVGDFISAAEWLASEGIGASTRLATFGGCNSGLLVAAAMTQRPELFAAVLCIVPLLDMVRYETFDQAVKWREEYGTVNDAEDFDALHAFSPYHRVKKNVNYPSVMLVSGDRDNQCDPAHTRKMAARLQQREAQLSQVIVDYDRERGHSPGLPLSFRVDALARRIAFLCRELEIPHPFGGTHEASGS